MNGNSVPTTTANTLPLSALRLSPSNVRKCSRGSIEAMAASIRSLAIIHNLAVIPDTENPGGFEVIVGGRRLRALHLLREQGAISDDYPVPCVVRDASEATAVSLAENVQREAMHPADEFDAFTKLTTEGRTIDQIADAFGVTPLVVERRLLLANAASSLVAEFRDGKLTTDQMIALCSTDDHALQESAWANAPSYNRTPEHLRRLVTRGEIDAGQDRRVAFIGGLVAFEAAGGEVRRDLFSADGNGGFIRDVALLEKLVADKLEAVAVTVRAEGWGWVEVLTEFDHQTYYRLGRVHPSVGVLSEADEVTVAGLVAEADQLRAEQQKLMDSPDEYSEEESDRIDTIEERLEALSEQIAGIEGANAVFTDDAKQHAGAWVVLDRDSIRIERGLVKTEDRKALSQATGSEVDGGRETKAAGRKDNAYSDALRRSLLGRRNHAVQVATARNPRVAKVLLAVQMVNMVRAERFYHGSGNDGAPCDLSLRDGYEGTRTNHPVTGQDADELREQLAIGLNDVLAVKLPQKQSELWDVLAKATDAELDALIACGVGASVSVVDTHRGLTAKLLDALSFDVSHHVCMTADNYFNRIPKPLTLDALKEAGLDHERPALEKMKRGELATEAERRIRAIDSGWVPKLIRTPAPKVAKATPAKAESAKAKKAPAGKKPNAKAAAKAAPKATAAKSKG